MPKFKNDFILEENYNNQISELQEHCHKIYRLEDASLLKKLVNAFSLIKGISARSYYIVSTIKNPHIYIDSNLHKQIIFWYRKNPIPLSIPLDTQDKFADFCLKGVDQIIAYSQQLSAPKEP